MRKFYRRDAEGDRVWDSFRTRIGDRFAPAISASQGDVVRVSGKDRDSLQEIIALMKQHDFGIDMQFTNYRTN